MRTRLLVALTPLAFGITGRAQPDSRFTTSSVPSPATAAISIASDSMLFVGTVGLPYSATLTATGGSPPYNWSVISGNTDKLTLDPNSGVLSGTPAAAGSFSFTVQVTDTLGEHATLTFSLIVNLPSIVSSSPFTATVGIPYSQRFLVNGGTPPFTWSLSGSVPGLSFDPIGAVLAGTPTTAGQYFITVQAVDATGLAVSRSYTLTVATTGSPLTITTATQLPSETLGAPLSPPVQLTASGGTPPYTWSASGLPSGLSLTAAGLISGTIESAGAISFVVTVTDNTGATASSLFHINVSPPSLPAITISGLPQNATPLMQYAVEVTIASVYPVDVTGMAILSSAPSDNGPADGSIQFASGGTSALFTVSAGNTASAPLAIQTGTVAGTITLTTSQIKAGGVDLTPVPAPSATTQIAGAAPVIAKATSSSNGNTITVQTIGYVTSREVTQAAYAFTSINGQTLSMSQFTIPLDSQFANYFQNPQNSSYGSQFVLSSTFTIQGDVNDVIPQNVTLSNRLGNTTLAVSN